MPTYEVTDPQTGVTLELTGDSPPSEQELTAIFAAQGGAKKAAPLAKYDGVFNSVVPEETRLRAASAIAGSQQAPLRPPTSNIPLLGPVLDIARTVRDAGPDVARNLVAQPGATLRGAAAGAAEGALSLLSPFNIAAYSLPKVAGALKGKPAAPPSPLTPTGTGTPLDIPLGAGAATSRATGTAMPLSAPAPLPKPSLPTPTGTATPTSIPLSPGGWSMPKAPKAAPVIHAPLEETSKAAAEIAEKLGPAQAAAAIEQKVKLSVSELASSMRARYGSERAGNMLFGNSKGGNVIDRFARKAAIKRLAPEPSRTPQIAEEAIQKSDLLRKFMDPKGAISPKLAAGIGTTALGAAAGATVGETPEDRIENGLIGAALGAVAVPMLAHVAAVGVPKAAQNALYTSVLSSPTSVFKAYLGAVGGSIAAATEKIAAGDVRSGQRILSTLFSPGSTTAFVSHIKNPKLVTGMAEDAPSLVGRFFGAGDAVARRAMAAGGIGADDAARYTLSGAPTTPLGKKILGLWSEYFILRLPSTLFPRVGIQLLERGIERSPLGLAGIKGINEGVSQGTKVARAAMGTAAAGAAYAGSDEVPSWAKPYLAAVSGVYGLPVAAGMALKSEGVSGALNEVARNMPFPQFGPGEAIKQIASGATLVPNALRDVAVARDPYERSTAGDFFGRTKAKIPGLRETLPVRGRRVNIAGEPIADRSTPLSRVLRPAPSKNEPMKGIPENVAAEIAKFGIELNPPTFEKSLTVGGKKLAVPPEAAEKAQRERRQYLVPAIEKLLSSAAYQSASDDSKRRRLDATISRAEAAGNARAKARLTQVLRRKP